MTNPFALELSPFPYDAEKGSTRWDIVNDLFGVLIIDSHIDLVDAWKVIAECKDADKRDAAMAALVEMPISEEEAIQIAASDWKDQLYRNEKIKEWGQFAKQTFNKAKELAKQ